MSAQRLERARTIAPVSNAKPHSVGFEAVRSIRLLPALRWRERASLRRFEARFQFVRSANISETLPHANCASAYNKEAAKSAARSSKHPRRDGPYRTRAGVS